MPKKMTNEQYRYLLQFLECNPNVATNKLSMRFNKKQLDAAWTILSQKLNSISMGAKKDTKEWRRTWSDLKYAVRQKAIRIKKSDTMAIEGESVEERLTELERRVLNLTGWQGVKEDVVHEDGFESFNNTVEEKIPIQIDSPVIQSISSGMPECIIEEHPPYITLQQDIESGTTRLKKKRKKEDTMQNVAVDLIELQNEILSQISASLASSSESYKKEIEISERRLELEEKIAIRKLEFQEKVAMKKLEMKQKIAERNLELKKRKVVAAEKKASALERIATFKEKQVTSTT